MPNLEIQRRNCINGLWGFPDDQNGPEWLTATQMIEKYISSNEGRAINLHDLRKFQMDFKPKDRLQAGGHGIEGTVKIVYEFKK